MKRSHVDFRKRKVNRLEKSYENDTEDQPSFLGCLAMKKLGFHSSFTSKKSLLQAEVNTSGKQALSCCLSCTARVRQAPLCPQGPKLWVSPRGATQGWLGKGQISKVGLGFSFCEELARQAAMKATGSGSSQGRESKPSKEQDSVNH